MITINGAKLDPRSLVTIGEEQVKCTGGSDILLKIEAPVLPPGKYDVKIIGSNGLALYM